MPLKYFKRSLLLLPALSVQELVCENFLCVVSKPLEYDFFSSFSLAQWALLWSSVTFLSSYFYEVILPYEGLTHSSIYLFFSYHVSWLSLACVRLACLSALCLDILMCFEDCDSHFDSLTKVFCSWLLSVIFFSKWFFFFCFGFLFHWLLITSCISCFAFETGGEVEFKKEIDHLIRKTIFIFFLGVCVLLWIFVKYFILFPLPLGKFLSSFGFSSPVRSFCCVCTAGDQTWSLVPRAPPTESHPPTPAQPILLSSMGSLGGFCGSTSRMLIACFIRLVPRTCSPSALPEEGDKERDSFGVFLFVSVDAGKTWKTHHDGFREYGLGWYWSCCKFLFIYVFFFGGSDKDKSTTHFL